MRTCNLQILLVCFLAQSNGSERPQGVIIAGRWTKPLTSSIGLSKAWCDVGYVVIASLCLVNAHHVRVSCVDAFSVDSVLYLTSIQSRIPAKWPN